MLPGTLSGAGFFHQPYDNIIIINYDELLMTNLLYMKIFWTVTWTLLKKLTLQKL